MAIDPGRLAVVLNPSSGPTREGTPEDRIRAAFRNVGIAPEIIVMQRGIDVRKLIRDRVAAGFSGVVASGGDGTVSTVGSVLAGSDTALGVLPTGTLNHFAKDMHLPVDMDEAVQVIARGETTYVDVAEVNGVIFLNNSSIGLYPTAVTERERLMKAGWPKTLAMARAALTALSRFPDTTVRLTTEDSGIVTRTPFLFVGNNRYELSGLQAGTRAGLSDGVLQLWTVANPSRSALLKAVVLSIIGKADGAPNVLSLDTRWAKVRTFRRHIKVALDGEVMRMTSPLVYTIRRAALKVIVPGSAEAKGEGV
jgi:YegS/Rv2252/BmrU family lipid kinase